MFIKNSFSFKRLVQIFAGLVVVIIFILMTNPFKRLISSIGLDTFTGGRDEIYVKAFNVMSSDTFQLFFGFGLGESSFHNYFIDVFFRLGIFAALLYFSILFYILVKITRLVKKTGLVNRAWFLITIIGQLLIQSLVNSPLSQPYYLINFVFVVMYFMYYPCPVPRPPYPRKIK